MSNKILNQGKILKKQNKKLNDLVTSDPDVFYSIISSFWLIVFKFLNFFLQIMMVYKTSYIEFALAL